MKHFFKSLFTTLLIGIPVVIVLMVALVFFQKDKNIAGTKPENKEENNIVEEMQDVPLQSKEFVIPEGTEEPEDTDSKDTESTDSTVILSFAGDVYFSEHSLASYDKKGISAYADEEMLSLMNSADLFMLNHEFSFSLQGEPMEDKQYTLQTDPKYVKILQELGTDVVTLANNHVLDFGNAALLDTFATLKQAEIEYVGAGNNYQEAISPVVRTIQGQSFAIFAATRVSPSADWYAGNKKAGVLQTYDPKGLNAAILEAKGSYDHIIVFLHWGIERNEMPEDYQRTLAKGYIDAGADLVIGCHPHVLQGFEYYKGVPIVYSLGNYLFGNRTGDTLLLNAEFSEDKSLKIQLIPCRRVDGVLTRIQEPDQLYRHLMEISYGAAVTHGGILIPQ